MGVPIRVGLATLLVTAALACVTGEAQAYNYTLGTDGETAESSQLANAIIERVRIPVAGLDQDNNGSDDRIEAEIIRPSDSGPLNQVPVIIDPSPYYTTLCRGFEGECLADNSAGTLNQHWPLFLDNFFVPRGYAVIYLEADGTGHSEGCPLHGGPGDIAAIKSIIDWLNGRVTGYNGLGYQYVADWDNGKAAMIGKSYDGTLTNGVAATGVDGLTTVVPESAISDWYLYSRTGGIRLKSAHYPAYLSNAVTNTDHQSACAFTRTDMNSSDGDATGDRNAWWDARNYLPNVGNVKASVFETHGLQDDNVTTDQFATWWAGLAANNVPRKLWLLREGHVDPFDSRRAVWVDTLHRWFDYWLDGVPNGIMDEPRVDIEDSKDDWNTYPDWPLPDANPWNVYLQGTGASTAGAVGLSSGGNVDSVAFTDSSTQSENAIMNTPTGSQASRRVFLSNVLTHDLRISGTPQLQLRASLDKTQSNLGVALVDYSGAPFTVINRSGDGEALDRSSNNCWGQAPPPAWGDHSNCYFNVTKPTQNVTQFRVTRGILDSSNRLSLYTPADVTIGKSTKFDFPLMPDDYTFKAGHQIAVIVVGDYRDISTPGTAGTTITVDTRGSRIVLPIVGGYSAALQSGAFTPDAVAPALTVPSDIVADPTDDHGATVTYPDPGVSDNEDPDPTTSCTPASGSHFPHGATTVTCTGRDATGNESTGTFTVTVTGSEPQTPPQGDIPAPPAPAGGGGDVPVPPTPSDTQPPASNGSGKPPTLDTVDKLAPKLAALAFKSGRHSLAAKFKLDEAATVTMAVYKHGAKKPLTTIKKKLRKGKDTLTARSSKLRKGTYTIRLTAVDAAGNARHVTKLFKIRH